MAKKKKTERVYLISLIREDERRNRMVTALRGLEGDSTKKKALANAGGT